MKKTLKSPSKVGPREYYYLGNHKCYSMYSKSGNGYEVSFFFGKDRIFYGNFIYEMEAVKWYKAMSKHLLTFTRKYAYAPGTPVDFYKHFCRSYLYKMYYQYLDTAFTTHQKSYGRAFDMSTKKYQTYFKKYSHAGNFYMEKARAS